LVDGDGDGEREGERERREPSALLFWKYEAIFSATEATDATAATVKPNEGNLVLSDGLMISMMESEEHHLSQKSE
jgi:hypothetical protein